MKLTKPVEILMPDELAQKTRKPKKMPAPEGDAKVYVTGVKEECPMDGFTLLGIQFHKTVYSSEKGYIQNQEKTYLPKLIARMLTENQAKALLERAKEVEFDITIANPDFDPEKKMDKNNVKWIQKNIVASDYLILIPAENYKEIEVVNIIEEKTNNIFDEAEKNQNGVYEAQKKKKDKG